MPTPTQQLNPSKLYDTLTKNGVRFFCGVPDSLLSPFSHYLESRAKSRHYIAVNEGHAVALAIGHYIATENIPLVYMQNSGIGNAINPLVSLADPLVMGIPMLLLIGWRGQHGHNDEPQHKKQGLVTTKLLENLDIKYVVLANKYNEVSRQITDSIQQARQTKRPFAFLVETGTLSPYTESRVEAPHVLSREEAIRDIVSSLKDSAVVIATTGKASRELFEHRETVGQGHAQDLLIVGGMGHASTIALSIAQEKPKRTIYCIDGDGAVLMHMGALAHIGATKPKNFYHFVINNGAHESVGGQPTIAFDIDLPAIAKACGYRKVIQVQDKSKLHQALQDIQKLAGPILVEVRVNTASRPNLGRPTISPEQNKDEFMNFLKD